MDRDFLKEGVSKSKNERVQDSRVRNNISLFGSGIGHNIFMLFFDDKCIESYT